MRVLILSNDETIVDPLRLLFESSGFVSETAADTEEAVETLRIDNFDIVVLDDPPGISGVREMRRAVVTTPIVALSRNRTISFKAEILNLGADDVMERPIHSDELIARLHAVTRRDRGAADNLIEIEDLIVDTQRQQASIAGGILNLTTAEYRVLELMARRRGWCVTRDMMLDHLYGGRDEPQIKILDVFVSRLRLKLRAVSMTRHIETVWGRGWRLGDAQ